MNRPLTNRPSLVGLLLALYMVVLFAYGARPTIAPGLLPGGDAQEYAHLAQSLLHGSILVDYDGPPRLTRYTPGFSILLMTAVAIGGLEAAVWVTYLCAIVLGGLAALLAWRVGGGPAAPIAVLLVLFNVGVYVMAHLIMSDVPSAAIALLELTLITLLYGTRSAGVAGVLAGFLVWIRPGSSLLVLAGLAGISASVRSKQRALAFALGLLPPVVALTLWQWSAFGSPLLTSYQATGVGANGSDLGGFLSLRYVFGPPWNTYSAGYEPNAVMYAMWLIGFDNELTYPGIGVLGVIGALLLARGIGPGRVVGLFTLAANVLTLLLYVPYFYRDVRFLIIPVVMNGVCAAVLLARGLRRLRLLLPIHYARRAGAPQPGRARASSSLGRGT